MAGVANDSKIISKDNIIVGKIKEDGPWVAEGTVQEVFSGNQCFVVHWKKIYGQQRSSRRQHKSVTWEPHQQAESHGVKFATEVTTCQAQGLPEVVGGLTCGGAPCSVWPGQEQYTRARAAAKRAREVIAFFRQEWQGHHQTERS